MRELVHDLTAKLRQKEISATTTYKHEVGVYFDLKTSRQNIMYTLFSSNISELGGKLEGMLRGGGVQKKNKKYA